MRKPLAALLVLALSAAVAAVACSSPCQDLATRICNCQPPGALQDNCNSSVKNQLGSGAEQPTAADEAYCESKLSTCPDPGGNPDAGICRALRAPSGKIACGLAFDADAGSGAPDAGTP